MKIGDARARIVIVLVEGRSEIACLRPVLSSLYESANPKYDVMFPPMIENGKNVWGDFTTKFGVTRRTAAGLIIKLYIKPLLQLYGLTSDCIGEIVHIVDMDGAYLEDTSIVYSKDTNNCHYGNGRILTSNPVNIIKRNEMKRDNIDFLSSIKYIGYEGFNIPYSCYFFSSNLDHYLHGDANLEKGLKVQMADDYARMFRGDPKAFLRDIRKRPGTLLNMSYDESWDFIKSRGDNSINPHTNINLLLDRIMPN